MLACTGHYLDARTLVIRPGYSTTVVVAAGGYPEGYAKGTPMTVNTPTEPDIVSLLHRKSDHSLLLGLI